MQLSQFALVRGCACRSGMSKTYPGQQCCGIAGGSQRTICLEQENRQPFAHASDLHGQHGCGKAADHAVSDAAVAQSA